MLKGKNIVLRPLKNSDSYFLKRIENNTDNWQFGSERKEYSDKELSDYIANSKTDIKVAKQYRFVIDLNRRKKDKYIYKNLYLILIICLNKFNIRKL